MPNGWDEVAGGFPAMTGNVPFLMKDVALLAVLFYLLKHDIESGVHSTDGAGTKNYLINQLARTMAALRPSPANIWNTTYFVPRW